MSDYFTAEISTTQRKSNTLFCEIPDPCVVEMSLLFTLINSLFSSLSLIYVEETQGELHDIASNFVEAAQTGQLATATNLPVTETSVTLPEPIRTDPTGGVRADNTTSRVLLMLSIFSISLTCFLDPISNV